MHYETTILIVTSLVALTYSNHDAKRLYDDLLRKSNYNKLIRPVGNASDKLTVKLGLKLSQLIDVDEKNEIITTNVWVKHEWEDFSLRWEPKEYGEVVFLYVPSESIWLPDVVLYNNADGDYTVTMMTKATLTYNGKVSWEPPAIYKSYCNISVKYFPFDEQICPIKFGIWTYDGLQVDLKHIKTDKIGLKDTEEIELGVDLTDYYQSVEWDLMRASARKTNIYYPCCSEPYPDVTFKLQIRRKTLFYTLNIMIPCISINLLTILTFYLPSDCGEKISLCISLLLSLSLFQLLLMDLVPATSNNVPLLGKYILFTMIVVAMSIFISVVTLNINYRSASTHELPAITKKIFLNILPKLLLMRRPEVRTTSRASDFLSEEMQAHNSINNHHDHHDHDLETELGDYRISSTFIGSRELFQNADLSNFCSACAERGGSRYPAHVKKALEGTLFIAKHLNDDDLSKNVKEDWKYIALVIDRLFLYIYITVCLVGTMGILLQPPMLYGNSRPLATGQNIDSPPNNLTRSALASPAGKFPTG